MISRSLMFHSAAWAMAGAARSLEEALRLQQKILEATAEDKGAETDGDVAVEDAPALEPMPPVVTAPKAVRPASRVIASARRSIRARHRAGSATTGSQDDA